MKKIILLVLLCEGILMNAQTCFEVKYTQSIKKLVVITQSASLYHNNGKSVYVYSKGEKGEVLKNQDGSEWDGKKVNQAFGGWYQDTTGTVFFKDFKAKEIHFREFFTGNAYISKEDFPTIVWSVVRESKKIGSFECFKGTTRFRGRNYTAWFTMDIPVNDGPWKLWGLPGLILEAYDDTEEVKFMFESIEYPCSSKVAITNPTTGTIVDLATYRKADDIEYEKWLRKNQAAAGLERRTDVKITFSRKPIPKMEKEYEQ
jgi:GLPGLI family protein